MKLCFQENLEAKLLSISPASSVCAKRYSAFPCSNWEKPDWPHLKDSKDGMEDTDGDEALGSWV